MHSIGMEIGFELSSAWLQQVGIARLVVSVHAHAWVFAVVWAYGWVQHSVKTCAEACACAKAIAGHANWPCQRTHEVTPCGGRFTVAQGARTAQVKAGAIALNALSLGCCIVGAARMRLHKSSETYDVSSKEFGNSGRECPACVV